MANTKKMNLSAFFLGFGIALSGNRNGKTNSTYVQMKNAEYTKAFDAGFETGKAYLLDVLTGKTPAAPGLTITDYIEVALADLTRSTS